MACLLLGVAIWMGVDRNFMTFIIGNNLYAAAVFIVLACGAIIFFISFLGCCGVVLDKSRMLVVVSNIAVFGNKACENFLAIIYLFIYCVGSACHCEIFTSIVRLLLAELIFSCKLIDARRI
jgi:hypothetical protein